jgi:hypothetical protein
VKDTVSFPTERFSVGDEALLVTPAAAALATNSVPAATIAVNLICPASRCKGVSSTRGIVPQRTWLANAAFREGKELRRFHGEVLDPAYGLEFAKNIKRGRSDLDIRDSYLKTETLSVNSRERARIEATETDPVRRVEGVTTVLLETSRFGRSGRYSTPATHRHSHYNIILLRQLQNICKNR